MFVPFGEWLPDQPALGASLRVRNVYPANQTYRPVPSFEAQSTNAISGTPLGGITARDAANNVYVYTGDASALYELAALTFTDESIGGGYSTSEDVWEFTVFNNQVIATNFDDPVQVLDIGGGASGAFANLITSTNQPAAKHVAVVRRFLVLGNTTDATDGHRPNRVWWSGINNGQDFDPDATTQSDYEDILDGGWIQKIVGGAEYGTIFQDFQISRMTYQGPPTIFDIFPVDRKRGTPIPGSVAALGRMIFYISEEGFFAFDGSQSIPIGNEKVDRTFWTQFDLNDRLRVSSDIDPFNKVVMWLFPGEGSTGGQPNKIFFYNWAENKWSEAELDVTILVQSATQGFTLEGLDSISTNLDLLSPSLDSDLWKGGRRRMGAFDMSGNFGFLSGSSLQATIDTPEFQIAPDRRSMVTSLRPMVQATGSPAITCEIGGRSQQPVANGFDSASAINSIGSCRVRNDNRYHRVRTNIPAGATWDHASGVEVEEFSVRGKR